MIENSSYRILALGLYNDQASLKQADYRARNISSDLGFSYHALQQSTIHDMEALFFHNDNWNQPSHVQKSMALLLNCISKLMSPEGLY